jgi:hypothetical protein
VIKKFLTWALSLFGPSKKEEPEAWPFPVPAEAKKELVKKATTRKAKPAAKKPVVVAKTAAKKTTKKKVK